MKIELIFRDIPVRFWGHNTYFYMLRLEKAFLPSLLIDCDPSNAPRQELQISLAVFVALKDGHRSKAPLSYMVANDYSPYSSHVGM